LWDATQLYAELFEQRGAQRIYTDYNISGIVANGVTWNGKKITKGEFFIGNKEKDPEVRITLYTKASQWHRSRTRRTDDPDTVHTFHTMLVINDLKSKANSPTRMAGAFERDNTLNNIVVFAFDTDAAQKRYWKLRGLDGVKTTNLSTIAPATPMQTVSGTPVVSAHRSKHSASAFILDENPQPRANSFYSAARSLEWHKATVDAKNGSGPYVILDKFYVEPPTPTAKLPYGFEGSMLRAVVADMRKAGLLTGQKVYGFKKDRVDKLGPNWYPLHTWLATHVATLLKKQNTLQEAADFNHAMLQNWRWDEKHRAEYPAGSLLREFLDDVHKMRNPKSNMELYKFIQSGRAVPWISLPTLPKPTIDLRAKQEAVLQKYPALLLQDDYNSRVAKPSQRKTIADYVTLVESK
jgi:hypothetical protein